MVGPRDLAVGVHRQDSRSIAAAFRHSDRDHRLLSALGLT
jgi:hypothetical protein